MYTCIMYYWFSFLRTKLSLLTTYNTQRDYIFFLIDQPEGSDGVDIEAVLLLADCGEPFLHPRHVGLLVRFPTSYTQYSTVQYSTVR